MYIFLGKGSHIQISNLMTSKVIMIMRILYTFTGDTEGPRVSINSRGLTKVGKKAMKYVNLTFAYYHVNHFVSECLPWNE